MQNQPQRTGGSVDEAIEQYNSMVFGIALTQTKNRSDADDIFQEVFFALYKYHKSNRQFNDEEHRKAWLIRTTLNFCKKTLSNSFRKKTTSLDELPEESILFDTEQQTLIYNALCELPAKYRTVLYLFYFLDLPITTISKVLKIKQGTIRMQLTRGREQLREKLQRNGDFDE